MHHNSYLLNGYHISDQLKNELLLDMDNKGWTMSEMYQKATAMERTRRGDNRGHETKIKAGTA